MDCMSSHRQTKKKTKNIQTRQELNPNAQALNEYWIFRRRYKWDLQLFWLMKVAIIGLQPMWLYSSSTSRLITRLMKGEGDPANSLSALPPLGVTVELAPGLGNPTKTVRERVECK